MQALKLESLRAPQSSSRAGIPPTPGSIQAPEYFQSSSRMGITPTPARSRAPQELQFQHLQSISRVCMCCNSNISRASPEQSNAPRNSRAVLPPTPGARRAREMLQRNAPKKCSVYFGCNSRASPEESNAPRSSRADPTAYSRSAPRSNLQRNAPKK